MLIQPRLLLLAALFCLAGASSPATEIELQEHETRFRQELRVHPDSALLWFNLGQVLLAQGRHSEALTAYQRVIELKSPLSPAAQIYRAQCFLEMGRPLRARQEIEIVDLAQLPPSLRRQAQDLSSQLQSLPEPDWTLDQYRMELTLGLDSNPFLLPQGQAPDANRFWRLSGELTGSQWQTEISLEEYNLDVEQSPQQGISRALTGSIKKPYDLELASVAVTLSPQLALDLLDGRHFLTRPSIQAVTQGIERPWRLAYRLESRMAVISEARYSSSIWNRLFFSYALGASDNHQWIPYLHLVDRQGESLDLAVGESLPLAYRGFGPGLNWKMSFSDSLFHDFNFRILRKSYKTEALPANLKRLDQELSISYRIHWQWQDRLGFFVQHNRFINSSNLGEGILLEDRNYRQWQVFGGLEWTGPI